MLVKTDDRTSRPAMTTQGVRQTETGAHTAARTVARTVAKMPAAWQTRPTSSSHPELPLELLEPLQRDPPPREQVAELDVALADHRSRAEVALRLFVEELRAHGFAQARQRVAGLDVRIDPEPRKPGLRV